MRHFLLASLLTALSAHAQGAPVSEEPSRSPASPVPEAPLPPLVQAPAPEQNSLPLAENPPLSLRRGARLRVELQSGQSHSGTLVSLEPGALSLREDPEHVLNLVLTDVQRLETRQRAVVPGLVAGGVLGAVSGGLLLGMICSFAGEGADVPACIAGGGLLGAALGVGAGAVMGLAVPRWSTFYEKEKHGQLVLRLTESEGDVLADWFAGADAIGEVGVQLGYARDMGIPQPTDGWGGRARLLVLIGPYLSLGPEAAWYSGVGTFTQVFNGETTVVRHSLWQLGALLRLGSEVGPVRAAVLGGLGLSDNRTGHAGGSVGGEVEALLGGRLPVALEVRYHFNIEREDAHPDPDYLTMGVGSRVRW